MNAQISYPQRDLLNSIWASDPQGIKGYAQLQLSIYGEVFPKGSAW